MVVATDNVGLLFYRAARLPRLKRSIATVALVFALLVPAAAQATDTGWDAALAASAPLALAPHDVVATGNDWIALPDIRASDGAITTFNVLSMRDRGVLQVQGASGVNAGAVRNMTPVIQPWVTVDNGAETLKVSAWRLIDDWIPVALADEGSVQATVSYVAPPDARAVLIHVALINRGATAQPVRFGVTARWGGLTRLIYTPSAINGQRLQADAPVWIKRTRLFSFVENETTFAWALGHPDCAEANHDGDAYVTQCRRTLAPGQQASADFIVSVGLEESSAAYAARLLASELATKGEASVLDDTRQWLAPRLRSTGNPKLDQFMNRNLLFSSLFAWGKALDTEQFVGVTSRSPRYYVSAAYWDRDAMLWSFPALLATDVARARRALDVAFGSQLRNAGVHSRFIDGVTLEPGFELDGNVAPIIALAAYWRKTGNIDYVRRQRTGLESLLARLETHRGKAGLYSTEQDSQDEYRRSNYETYDNALVWRALKDAAALSKALDDAGSARDLENRAQQLHAAVMRALVAPGAPGADGPTFAFGWNGTHYEFDDVPPGSLLKLPMLGFIDQNAPVFRRTYVWLHSAAFKYSNVDKRYGLPGSYRVPDTTSWSIADHLRLTAGKTKAMAILRASPWDGGIVSEQIDPVTGASVAGGGAFATAAGYLAATVCDLYCQPKPARPAPID